MKTPCNKVACIFLLVAMLASCGCQSSGVYSPDSLPGEYAAMMPRKPGQIVLSRFSSNAMQGDRIYLGDVLSLTITTGAEKTTPRPTLIRVAENGAVFVPLVGDIPVNGFDLTSAEARITEECIRRRVYINPTVSLIMKERKKNRITVTGAVEKPGLYELPANDSNIVAAITAASGLSEDADTRLEIRSPAVHPERDQHGNLVRQTSYDPLDRGQTRMIGYDLAEADPSQNYDLPDGTVVTVMKQEPTIIQLIGRINSPGRFEKPPNQSIRLLDAIALGKGRQYLFADKVKIIRRKPGVDQPIMINVSVSQAKADPKHNVLLQSGDVVNVEETPLTFAAHTLTQIIRVGISGSVPLF